MKSIMFPQLCLGFLCALVTHISATCETEVKISIKTLKSDLDMILDRTTLTRTINIKYAEGAVLSVLRQENRDGTGQSITIKGALKIKLPNGSTLKKKDLVYNEGSFGLPSNHADVTYVIIKPDTEKSITPALDTIKYIPIKHLTKTLQKEFQEVTQHNHIKDTFYIGLNFPIGLKETSIKYRPGDERLILSTPLKGISLYGGENDGCCEMLKVLGNDDDDSYPRNKQVDVLFDVWFDPMSKLYGSSSGSIAWVDAVRIFDEWNQDIAREDGRRLVVEERRGEDIRKEIFDHDMSTAYKRLHSEKYENVILDYANEIVLDVRRGDQGDHRFVKAKGTTNADATGKTTINVEAYYDLQKLEYSDHTATKEEFVPGNYGDKSSSLKYIHWDTFKKHLNGTWAALQGGCRDVPTRVYAFSMYRDNVRLTYDCTTKTIMLHGTITALINTRIFGKATLRKLENVIYRDRNGILSPSLLADMTPIAIQLQQQLPSTYAGQMYTKAELFRNEMNFITTVLSNNENSKSPGKPTLGTVILDEKAWFMMHRSKEMKCSRCAKIDGNFKVQSEAHSISHKTLNFNTAGFTALSGVPVHDVFISGRYKKYDRNSLPPNVIASKYLTLPQLTLYLRKVMNEALKRCVSREEKALWFKLVQHEKFALSGFCDCSQSVLLVEGKFRALLITKTDKRFEVKTERLIQDLIYITKEAILIPGSGRLDEVIAISVPKTDNWDYERQSFGAPVTIDSDVFVVFKSDD